MDGTMGPAGPLAGPNYLIGADLGQLRGANLFHSFQQFDLAKTESATFSGPNTVANIIGRVTGGSASSIDGLIKSEIPGANLFLLNPSGVIFGPNAQLNVSGSFHASTADYLRLADGGIFYANPSSGSVLTVAAPSAFGFLSENPAGISVQGSGLKVLTGKTLSLTGGDIELKGGNGYGAYLSAPAGRVDIASVASPGEVVPNAPGQPPSLDVGSFARLGNIAMTQGQIVTGSTSGGGTVVIRAGRFLIDSTTSTTSFINCATRGNVDGAPTAVDIAVKDDFVLAAGEIAASSFGAGKAGDIRIQAGTLELNTNPSYLYTNIASRAYGSGSGGAIDITTGDLVVKNGAGIYTAALGDFYYAYPNAAGPGGNVTVNTGTLTVLDGGYIGANTFSATKGGNLTVTVTGDALLAGMNVMGKGVFTGLGTQADYGGTGGVTQVTAGSIRVIDGAGISAPNFGAGLGGSVVIDAGSVELDNRGIISTAAFGNGPAGNITVKTDSLEVKRASYISSTGFYGAGKGNAGDIDVTAGRILLAGLDSTPRPFDLDATAIFSGVRDGQGGNIRITADSLTMTNRALISGASYGSGSAGNIAVDAGGVDLLSGSFILSSTFGTGAGGNIDVTASRLAVSGVHAEPVKDITGATQLTPSAIASQSASSNGTAGEVRITAGSLELLDGGRLSTETFGQGTAGNIVVQAETVRISGVNPDLRQFLATNGSDTSKAASGIFSGSNGPTNGDGTAVTGPAGNLQLAAGVLDIRDGGRISSETNASGAGGAIDLQADKVLLDGGAAISAKSSGTGNAGNITIAAARSLDVSNNGGILTSSTGGTGNSGTLDITAGEIRITGIRDAVDPLNNPLEFTGFSSATNAGLGGELRVTTPNLLVADKGAITASSIGAGTGGKITIASDTVSLAGGATISAKSSGTGNAGDITIVATDSLESRSGFVTTEAARSDGGNITLKVGSLVHLVDSEITASVGGGPETVGGNISIDPQFVILKNSRIIANAYEGKGGNILIAANVFLADPDSVVDASSALGVSGTVDIRAVISNITGFLGPLPSDTLSASALLRERCIARIRKGKYSSFVVGGRDGIPIEPGNLMPSPPF